MIACAVEQAHDAVNLGGLERFGEGQIRQDRRQPFRQHRFAGAGRADEDDVVAAGGGDFERALDVLLSFDVVEVRVVVRMLTE